MDVEPDRLYVRRDLKNIQATPIETLIDYGSKIADAGCPLPVPELGLSSGRDWLRNCLPENEVIAVTDRNISANNAYLKLATGWN